MYNYGVQNKTLAASIVMTSLRDGYHVVHAPTLPSTAAIIAHVAAQLAIGGLTPKHSPVASGALGKRPRDIKAALPPLVAPLAAITGVSLETAELLASQYESDSKLVAASEEEVGAERELLKYGEEPLGVFKFLDLDTRGAAGLLKSEGFE